MSDYDNKYLNGAGLKQVIDALMATLEAGHSGSMNADMVDGKHASEFSLSGHTHEVVNGYQINVSTSAPGSGTASNIITFVK